jgi:plastocyanin
MLEQIWDAILELTSKLVIPDWGALVALLPIGIGVIVAVWVVATFRRLREAPPARRGKQPITPRPPPGVHLPGPSWSPIFAAIGAFLLLLGLVFGGPILVLGAIALVLTLLYWLSDALNIWERERGEPRPQLPAVIHEPPSGVHMPGPSFRPIIGALGTFFLFLGLVFGEWLLLVGVLILVLTLIGWLPDALREYDKTVQADQTGHLEGSPAPPIPRALLSVIAILVIGAFAFQVGWLPPGSASGGQGATASGTPPAGSGAPPPASGGPSGSGAPGGSGAPAGGGGVTITAQGVKFVETSVTFPANTPFNITFVNDDAGTPHNVDIHDASGAEMFKGEIFSGVATKTYSVPALPAGSYTFICDVHPQQMTGTATAQ